MKVWNTMCIVQVPKYGRVFLVYALKYVPDSISLLMRYKT